MSHSLLLRYFQAHQSAHRAIKAEAFAVAMAEANQVRDLLEQEGNLTAEPKTATKRLTSEKIEAGASALVDSCIYKGHWKHATDESKAAYRQHAKAVLSAAQSADDTPNE